MEVTIISSLQKALALQRALKKLLRADYPSESSRTLAELLFVLSDNIAERLLQLASKEGSALAEVQPDEVLVLGRAMAQLARLAEPVARSRAENVPWGIILPVETLCRRVSPESRVIIHPQWEYNYTYYELMKPLRRIMAGVGGERVEALFEGYPSYFAVLAFPAVEEFNILQSAAWGHEIGHHLNVVFGITEHVLEHQILDPSDIDVAVTEVLRIGGQSQFPPESREQLRILILERAARATRNWVAELVSDVLSVHVFGPASLFAFSDIVPVLHPLDQPDVTHPPARLRMRVMLEELKRLGYVDLFAESQNGETEEAVKTAVSAEFARLQALCEREPTDGGEPYYIPALKASQAAIPIIVEEVRKVSTERWACSVTTLRQEVFKLVERLIHEIPPCEIDDSTKLTGRPVSLAGIVNAGWLYRILHRQRLIVKDESDAVRWQEMLDKLNELILKAIELRDIRWRLLPRSSTDESSEDRAQCRHPN